MAVFNVSNMEQLIALDGIASGDVITLTADIDAVAQGYDDFVTLSTSYDVNLNGHTLSNVFLSGTGIFNKTISNGTLTNIYIDGNPTLRLSSVSGSFYITGSVGLLLTRSSADVTCSPLHAKTGLSGSQSCIFSNVVIRNAVFAGDSSFTLRVGTSHNFAGIVFDNCKIGAGTSSDVTINFSGKHSYLAMHNCTVDSNVTSLTASNSVGAQTALICAPLTSAPTYHTAVTEAQLRNREYLEQIGFLP